MQPGPSRAWPHRTVGATAGPAAPGPVVAPTSAPAAGAGASRMALSPDFLRGLKGLARVGGITLAGAPIVLGAVGELQNTEDNAMTNLAAAGGNAAGGIGGGLLAAGALTALSGGTLAPLAPLAFGLGAWGGGDIGGKIARFGANAIQGISNDPLDKEIREGDKRFAAELQRRELEAAAAAKYAEIARQAQRQDAILANQLEQGNQYQAALLNAAMSGVNPATLSFAAGMA